MLNLSSLILAVLTIIIPNTSFALLVATQQKNPAAMKQVRMPYDFTTSTGTTDKYGFVYLAGYGSQPVAQVNNLIYGYDSKVIKVNPETGEVLWEKYIALSDSGNSDYVTYIEATSNAIYFLAEANEGPLPPTNGMIYSPASYHMSVKLVKLNPTNGDVLSITAFNDTATDTAGGIHNANVFSRGLTVSDSGEIGVIGYTGTWNGMTAGSMQGNKKWLVSKVNAAGEIVWRNYASGDYVGYAGAPAENLPKKLFFVNDRIVVVGQYDNTATFKDMAINSYSLSTGALLDEQVVLTFGNYSVETPEALTVNNGNLYILAGAYNLYGSYGGLLLKTPLSSISLTSLHFMSSAGTFTRFKKLEVTNSGNIFLAGTYDPATTFEAIDGFVTKYDANGNVLWTNYKNGSNAYIDFGSFVEVDSNERVYLTSNLDAGSNGYDIGMDVYSSDGSQLGSQTYDGEYQSDDIVYFVLKTYKYNIIFAKGGEYSKLPTTPYLMITELSKSHGVNNVENTVLQTQIGTLHN